MVKQFKIVFCDIHVYTASTSHVDVF